MSLHPEPIGAIPEQTARVAHAAFPAGNPYLRMRDELESLVEDRDMAHLFPRRGQPAERPWRLALITIFRFVEDLSDRAMIGTTHSDSSSTILGLITRCSANSAAAWLMVVPSGCCSISPSTASVRRACSTPVGGRLAGTPRARTMHSAFARLLAQP
jgi:hypothetical protein